MAPNGTAGRRHPRLLAAIDEGWADSEAGRVVDDDELDRELAPLLARSGR